MAATGPVQDLCDEATCPICLDYFTDPVTITECGHNFCQGCLVQYWGEEDGHALVVSCPQCRESTQRNNLIPNRALRNMVEIARQLFTGQKEASSLLGNTQRSTGQREARSEGWYCEKHQEPLKLFCKDHQAPICVVCDRSKEHENHKVVPQEEACLEYKDQICSRLEILRAERKQILKYKAGAAIESQKLLNQTEDERQTTKADFRRLHQYLEKQEKIVLAQIEEVEKEIARRRDEHLARLCRELSSLENLIQEMEEKKQQPANEFLQDIVKTLERYEKKKTPLANPVAFPPELTCRIKGFYDVKPLLKVVVEQFPANVTLDPGTAHPQLILSEDHKSMRWGDRHQALPNNPERFDCIPCVLGLEGLAAGRHFWEVIVGSEESWAVGVAIKSVRRKGGFGFSPAEGIWAVGKWEGYRVFTAPHSTPLPLRQELNRIRVTLNCAERQVSFSDADTGVHLYTYAGASFGRQTLYPFFWVQHKARLRLSCSTLLQTSRQPEGSDTGSFIQHVLGKFLGLKS